MKITTQGLNDVAVTCNICRKFSQLTKLTIIEEPYLAVRNDELNHIDHLGKVEELHYVKTATFDAPAPENRAKRLILDNGDMKKF